MATREDRIKLLEDLISVLAEEAREAYRTWDAADRALQSVVDELRELRRPTGEA